VLERHRTGACSTAKRSHSTAPERSPASGQPPPRRAPAGA
jgi:hypothetical protein